MIPFSFTYTEVSAAVDAVFFIILAMMVIVYFTNPSIKREIRTDVSAIDRMVSGASINRTQEKTTREFIKGTSFIGPGLFLLGALVFAVIPMAIGLYMTYVAVSVNSYYTHRRGK